MQLSLLLRDRHFWIGFGTGCMVVVFLVLSLTVLWIVRAKHQVERHLDQQWAAFEAQTRPLLDAPVIPPGGTGTKALGPSPLVVDLSQWRLETLEDGTIEGSQLAGHPLFINLWATWCSPCVAELPAIKNLAASPEARKLHLRFLLVTDETPKAVERFLARRPDLRGLPVALAHDGVPAGIWSRTRPETSILGCRGEVILSQTGPADWSAPPFRRYLAAALGRSCGT